MGYCPSSDPARSGAITRRSSLSFGSIVSSANSPMALVYWMSSLGIPRLTLSIAGPSATEFSSNLVLPTYTPFRLLLRRSVPRLFPLCSTPRPPRLIPHQLSIPTCRPIVNLPPYSTFVFAIS